MAEMTDMRTTIREILADIITEEIQPAGLTRAQAARYLGVSERQLARYQVPCVRLPGRLVRYRTQDLDKFLDRYTVGTRRVRQGAM